MACILEYVSVDLVRLHAKKGPCLRVVSPDLRHELPVQGNAKGSEVPVFPVLAPDEFRQEQRARGKPFLDSVAKGRGVAKSADYEGFNPVGLQMFVDLLNETCVTAFPSWIDQGGIQPNSDPVALFLACPGRPDSHLGVGSAVLVARPCLPGCQCPGHRDVGGWILGQQGVYARALGPQFEPGCRIAPNYGDRGRSEPAPALQGERVGKLACVVDGRLVARVPLEMDGKFLEKVCLVDEKDRCAMVEVPLQEAVLAIKRTAIGVSHIELGRGRVFPGPGEGPDAGSRMVGKDENVALDARVVSL